MSDITDPGYRYDQHRIAKSEDRIATLEAQLAAAKEENRSLKNSVPFDEAIRKDLEEALRESDKENTNLRASLAELRKVADRDAARLHWLHDCSTGHTDPEGYEWGIYRVKWENGNSVSVMATFSDFSDLDAEMARELAAWKARNPE